VLVAGGMTVAFAVTNGTLSPGAASAGGSKAQWEALAQCESGGNWAINTGNGYHGGLQFNLATWRGLGLGGYPHEASKAQQIAAGSKLHDQRGWQPWPACSRKLGLSGNGGVTSAPAPAAVASTTAARREAASRASRSRSNAAVRVVAQGTAAPAFDGRVMTVADIRTFRPAVQQWQRQMKARGWKISADGFFGPQSASVAKRFAAEKGLSAPVGTVNGAVWAAAWSASVTRR